MAVNVEEAMAIADVQKFIAENHRGVFVARKRDGLPQITLVTRDSSLSPLLVFPKTGDD